MLSCRYAATIWCVYVRSINYQRQSSYYTSGPLRTWSEYRIILVSIVRNADKRLPDGNERGSRSTAVIDSLHSAIPANSETFTVAIAGRYIYGTFPDSGTDPVMSYWIRNQRGSTSTRPQTLVSRWNVQSSERLRPWNQKQCNWKFINCREQKYMYTKSSYTFMYIFPGCRN